MNDWKWLSPDQQAVAQLVEPLITDTFAITVAPAIAGSGNRYIINKISTNVDKVYDKKMFFPLNKLYGKYTGDYYSPFKIKKLLDEVKDREFSGYSYDGADASFELLANRLLGKVPEPQQQHRRTNRP